METAACVSGFLQLFFITGVHLSSDPQLHFEIEGGNATFNTWSTDDHVLYRVLEDRDLLLVNCSQPDTPHPDGYEVKCFNFRYFTFKMYNLTLSQSGDYRAEGWRGGNITKQKSFRLAICPESDERPSEENVMIGGSTVLCRLNSTLEDGSSLQLYHKSQTETLTLVLDTNSSLKPLERDFQGRLQIDLKTSLVTLLEFAMFDSEFYCTVWRGSQCQSYNPVFLSQSIKHVFAYEEEKLSVPCISGRHISSSMYHMWGTPTGLVTPTVNQIHQQEMMFMLEDRRTGNCSLVIPSLSLRNSGRYYYIRNNEMLKEFILFICNKFSPLDVILSHGKSVLLDITEHLNESWSIHGIEWSYRKSLQPQVLILDSKHDPLLMPEDLRGRVTVSKSPSNSSLTISNLTAEDSGLYTWRVYGKLNEELSDYFCFEGTFLLYMDPFGVTSPFYKAYASLMGCALLGLVTAVICFELRRRRGQKTSGHQSRKGQHSEDEDLYDNIEMVELSV